MIHSTIIEQCSPYIYWESVREKNAPSQIWHFSECHITLPKCMCFCSCNQ